MREIVFKMERPGLVEVGQEVDVSESVTPVNVNYMIEPAVAMSGLFRFTERLKSKKGIVKDIIQNDRGNRYSPTVIVVAVTTRRKKPQLPVHVLLTREESGLKEDSIVLTEQVRTLEKTRLTRYLGTVTAQAMKRIDRALGMSIGSI